MNFQYKKSLAFILGAIKPFPKTVIFMLWVALLWAVDLSLRPYILKLIINTMTEAPQESLFYPILSYLFLTFVMFNSARLNTYFVDVKLNPILKKKIALDAVHRLFEEKYAFYQETYSGALASKINDLTIHVPECLQIIFDRFLSYFFALLIALCFLWNISTAFALIMGVWSLAFVLCAIFYAKNLIYLSDCLAKKSSQITGQLIDVFSNIQSVFLFGQKPSERSCLEDSYDSSVRSERRLYQTHFWIWIIYDYSFFITLILNFFFLVKGKNEGWITIGDFILVTRITLGVVEFLWKFTREFAKFTKSLGSINNALETIQLIEDFLQTSQKALLQIQKGEIIFQEVSFHYSESESLFENLELKIPGGQKIGIVGYSGAGKTSLANLLLRLFDPVRGAVLIDNQDIRTISDESFYAAVTTIPQEPILFHRSIYENIAYGSSDVTKEQVIQAAQNAYIHDFISLLRDGYDTLVGERGVKLSGGQKQRIVIARAFLKNSPILILDEATSQIDTLTEKTIQASLKKLFQSKTVIVIAHRISTLHLMDRVIVLDAGRVVGDGTHGDLLKQCELYAKLWKNQFKGFFP